jgi:hypothetical protein
MEGEGIKDSANLPYSFLASVSFASPKPSPSLIKFIACTSGNLGRQQQYEWASKL